MGSAKAETVAGERKAVTSIRSRFRETKGCGEPEGFEPCGGKTSYGEPTGKRPVLWNARLRTVHAGCESGWELGHLEPSLFLLSAFSRQLSAQSPYSFKPDRRLLIALGYPEPMG